LAFAKLNLDRKRPHKLFDQFFKENSDSASVRHR